MAAVSVNAVDLGGAFQPAGPLPSTYEGIAALARTLEPPAPYELPGLLRDECAFLLDGLLTRVARARGAVDVAMGELLADLDAGQRVIALGFSGVADYGREVLDVGESTARNLARLARALRDRPLLRAAVWSGEVSTRKAETILAVARGDAEALWVARAKASTVRALRAAVKATAGSAPEEDEPWSRVEVVLTPEQRVVVEEALDLAGKVLERPGAPRWQKLEVICCEYLAEHPVEPDDADRRCAAPWDPDPSAAGGGEGLARAGAPALVLPRGGPAGRGGARGCGCRPHCRSARRTPARARRAPRRVGRPRRAPRDAPAHDRALARHAVRLLRPLLR